MRLIDADELTKNICKWLRPSNPEENEMVDICDIGASVIMQIEEQPTAYDLDKVMERLEDNAHYMEICEEQHYMNTSYFIDVPYKMVKLEDAIEIVEAGGKE